MMNLKRKVNWKIVLYINFSKNSNSVNMFNINIKQNIIEDTNNKDFKNF